MRFTILENEIHEVTQTQFDEFIEKNCQQFIKESKGKNLYRGISTKQTKAERFIATPLKNRAPKDMPLDIHKFLNNLFLQKFGWPARSMSIFGSSRRHIAGYYGTPYKIYPTDDFEFIWSPEIDDLYIKYDQYIGEIRAVYRPNPTPQEVIEEYLVQLVKTYRNDDLAEAIKSENEIMILCDQYAGEWTG